MSIKYNLSELLQLNYGKLYEKLALNDMDYSSLVGLEKNIFEKRCVLEKSDYSYEDLPLKISDILFEDYSAQLLWLLRSTSIGDSNALAERCQYIKDISTITRGGLNIYKRIGWDIHVLYAYQIVNWNFAKKIPTVYLDITTIKEYHDIFNSLSFNAKFILKVATFLHDIGVVDGVSDHEIKGLNWVFQRYEELEIPQSLLAQHGITLRKNEIIALLEIIVSNHQMINQIGSEISDYFVKERIDAAMARLSEMNNACELFEGYFCDIMYLLSVGDLLAVRDSLLTKEKIEESHESVKFLKNLLQKKSCARDSYLNGIQRFRSLLKDELKNQFSNTVFNNSIIMLGKDPLAISSFLYEIKQISYAMTVVKPNTSYITGLKLFCCLFDYFKINNLDPKNIMIKFDPNINANSVQDFINGIDSYSDIILGKCQLQIKTNDNSVYVEFLEEK